MRLLTAVGRKRHIAVNTDGRLLMVNLTPADISDGARAQTILDAIRKRWPCIKHLFADGAHDRCLLIDKAAFLDFVIEVIRRIDTQPRFKVPHGGVWSSAPSDGSPVGADSSETTNSVSTSPKP